MPENAALSQLSKNEGITRRDFLKLGLGGFAATLMNFAIGSVIEKRQIELQKIQNSLSEYQINWYARPWVWINLALAAKRINELEIQPGQSVSVIDVIGLNNLDHLPEDNTDPRVGYIVAQMASGLDGLGYGLCLASTAIFRAALASPLHIVEHGTHYDLYPDYFKDFSVGTDAAIYSPGPDDKLPITDLVLQNPNSFPVKIVFEVFDMAGNLVTSPEKNISQIIYKGAYANHGAKLMRRLAERMLGLEIPPAAFPEYALGNKKITVRVAMVLPSTQQSIDYYVDMTNMQTSDDSHNVRYSRILVINKEDGQQHKIVENFESQYGKMPTEVFPENGS